MGRTAHQAHAREGGRIVAVSFEVPFVHGLQRPRFHGHAYDTARNREDKEHIAAMYRNACREKPAARPVQAPKDVPVVVRIVVHRPVPVSRPKRVTQEHDLYKPDLDNVAKLVLDALNRVAWADDCQIVQLSVSKAPRARGVEEHTTVTIIRPDWGD